MSNKKQKKKKEKIIYIDDGRTIADMSGTSGGIFSSKGKKDRPKPTVSANQKSSRSSSRRRACRSWHFSSDRWLTPAT